MPRFPSLATGTVPCPRCGADVDLPLTVLPIPVGGDTAKSLLTMPPLVHRCETAPTNGAAS